jgi:hypothetical protein
MHLPWVLSLSPSQTLSNPNESNYLIFYHMSFFLPGLKLQEFLDISQIFSPYCSHFMTLYDYHDQCSSFMPTFAKSVSSVATQLYNMSLETFFLSSMFQAFTSSLLIHYNVPPIDFLVHCNLCSFVWFSLSLSLSLSFSLSSLGSYPSLDPIPTTWIVFTANCSVIFAKLLHIQYHNSIFVGVFQVSFPPDV